MKIKKEAILILSGLTWFVIGFYLLSKGLHFIVAAASTKVGNPPMLLPWIASWSGGMEAAAVILIALSLVVGFIKGKFAIRRSATRIVKYILDKPGSVPIKEMYPKYYYVILLSMVLLGVLMRILPIPLDIRGLVDAAIGVALIQGGMLYFRTAITHNKPVSQ